MALIQKLKEAREKGAKERKEAHEKYEKHVKKVKELAHALKEKNIVLFPGTLEEYSTLIGYPCEIIPLDGAKQYVEGDVRDRLLRDYSQKFQEKMLEEGIEALIHYSIITGFGHPERYIGVPIKKKISF